jgi:hypothetical protein
MSYRTVLSRLAGLALVAATVAAGGTALAAPSARPAKPTALVPLSQVGLGWSIAEYSTAPVPPKKGNGVTALYAVSPQGKKYKFYSWPARPLSSTSNYYVVDWSGDKQRVLVTNSFGKYEQISLVTGKVIDSFKLPATVSAISYTRPDGLNVLTTGTDGIGARRYDFTGKLQQVLATKGFNSIEAPDGTSVIVGTNSGIEQVSNSGVLIKQLHPTVSVDGCYPLRWWTASTVLADCNAKHGPSLPRLWLFPVNGGQATALTAQRSGHDKDQGDLDAWKLSSGVYTQAAIACGVVAIAKQSGQLDNPPSLHFGSYTIITGHGSSLLVQADSGCSPGASLLWYNPSSKKVSWVFHTPGKVIGVEAVVPFGRPLS